MTARTPSNSTSTPLTQSRRGEMRFLHIQFQACMQRLLCDYASHLWGLLQRIACMPPAILADVSCRRHPQSGAEGCASSSSARSSHAWRWQAASYRHQIQRYIRNLGLKVAPVASQTEAAMLGVGKLPLTDTRYSGTDAMWGLKGAPVGSQTEADMLGLCTLPLTDTRYSATDSYEVLQTPCIPLFCMAASDRSCKPSSATFST